MLLVSLNSPPKSQMFARAAEHKQVWHVTPAKIMP